MNLQTFKESLEKNDIPKGIPPLLLALWHEGNDDWEKAHNIAQDVADNDGSWVHAYLHRVEGDSWNANYWYRRAGRKMPDYSLEQEWEELVKYFCDK